MYDGKSIDSFLSDINNEIRGLVANDSGLNWDSCFAEILIEYLTEAAEIDDGEVFEHKRKGIKINGYSYGSDKDSLDLFIVICSGKEPSQSISQKKIESEFQKAENFFKKCRNGGYFNLIEESSPVLDLALLIHERRNLLKNVRFFLFTDCRSKPLTIPVKKTDSLTISYNIWDINRLYQMLSSGKKREPIEIDFVKEFSHMIPCLETGDNNPDYKTVLAVFHAKILSDLYERYGARLLERNVRSFLQARGNVNKGIRRTLNTKPEMFLAFNNGITGTAEDIKFEKTGSGIFIRYLKDFQIVNGGQTTASLYHTAKKDKVELTGAFVQAKICIVNNKDKVSEIVPLISKFSNSQNKVNDADFYANDPFHIKVEEMSRSIWAPPLPGSNQQTHWFYERARGQYNDEKSKLTPAQKKKFSAENPSKQKITKTDLAKFENTWEQLPWIVSLGAQKNFRDFTLRLAEKKSIKADDIYFKNLIAKGILFKETEKLVSAQKFGGYRANIVTYAIALLSYKTDQAINFDKVWKNQTLSANLSEVIKKISHIVHSHITSPPGGRNITEWCKKEDCWNQLKAKKMPSVVKFFNDNETDLFDSYIKNLSVNQDEEIQII
ncbi:MAG: AIPR family protein [Candidatus Muiribacteriota bacterium]